MELNDLCCSPNIIRVIKLRRMRLSGYVARVGERRRAYRALMGKPGNSGYLEDPGVEGMIILR